MANNPRGLLRHFIKENYADEIEETKSLHQQSRVGIDYNKLTVIY